MYIYMYIYMYVYIYIYVYNRIYGDTVYGDLRGMYNMFQFQKG